MYFKPTLTLSFVAVLLFSACGGKKDVLDPLVDIAVVQSVSGSHFASYPGRTEAGTSTDLSFMLVGTIDKLLVKEGDHVSRGQVLARLDTRDYQLQLKATQAEYNQVKAECERVIAMHAERAVSDNNYDKARSGLEQITLKLNHHKDQLSDCVLTSPYDGFVETVHRSDREAVAPGIPVVTIFSSNGSDIIINIPETEYGRRKSITSCYAVFSSMPGRQVPLRIKSIASMANANQVYQMRLSLGEVVPDITPGMSVMVYVNYGQGKQSPEVLVPVGALWAQGQQSYVYLLDESTSQITAVPVTVENFRPDGNAIISDGLSDGDKIVASGIHHLADGQKVRQVAEPAEVLIEN